MNYLPEQMREADRRIAEKARRDEFHARLAEFRSQVRMMLVQHDLSEADLERSLNESGTAFDWTDAFEMGLTVDEIERYIENEIEA